MDWEPAHADHAIDNVSVIVSLSTSIDLNTFDELVVAARKAGAPLGFTHRVDGVEPLQFPVGGEIVFDTATMVHRRRVGFQRHIDGVPIGEFAIGPTSINLTSSRYTNWSSFQEIAVSLMTTLDTVSPVLSSVQSIQLQYVDTFTSKKVLADHFEVVSKDSTFLVQAVQSKNRAFHCHTGWFDYADSRRSLTNVNIGVVDNSPPASPDSMSKITILTMVRFDGLTALLEDPLSQLAQQHTYLKELFSDIITPEAALRVALND